MKLSHRRVLRFLRVIYRASSIKIRTQIRRANLICLTSFHSLTNHLKRGKESMSNQKNQVAKGGSFLLEDISFERVFTPEDYNNEQKMIAKTTEEFIINEVLPQVEYME